MTTASHRPRNCPCTARQRPRRAPSVEHRAPRRALGTRLAAHTTTACARCGTYHGGHVRPHRRSAFDSAHFRAVLGHFPPVSRSSPAWSTPPTAAADGADHRFVRLDLARPAARRVLPMLTSDSWQAIEPSGKSASTCCATRARCADLRPQQRRRPDRLQSVRRRVMEPGTVGLAGHRRRRRLDRLRDPRRDHARRPLAGRRCSDRPGPPRRGARAAGVLPRQVGSFLAGQ